MSKTIALTRGFVAIVDNKDYNFLSQYKWYIAKRGKKTFNYYAARNSGRKPNRVTIFMHTEIMGKGIGKEIDHIDGNGLNNQRKNLRLVTHAENMANQTKIYINNTSGVPKVHRHKMSGKWQVSMWRNGKNEYMGLFSTKEEAINYLKKLEDEN